MPNLATALKEEIRRLARKEIKLQVTATKRAAAQHRREIAALKRELRDQGRKIARLETQSQRSGSAPAKDEGPTQGKRFSAKGLKTHRQRLGLSAADYGRLVGVTGQTIYLWEQSKSRPRTSQFEALLTTRTLGKRAAQAQLAELNGKSKTRTRRKRARR